MGLIRKTTGVVSSPIKTTVQVLNNLNSGQAAKAVCPTCGPPPCLTTECQGKLKQVLGRKPIQYRCIICQKEWTLSEILKARGSL